MADMTGSLPPLNALRAFESAARHLSFKRAADELHVTPAAISHHVKSLEATLDVQLFHRLTRALRLTEAGQAALPLLSEGFDRLREGTDQMRAHGNSGLLTLSVSPSFASLWLVPRLDRFHACHPEIEIRIDGTDRLVDVARGETDVAIRYGPGGYEGVVVDTLFGQRNTPVCSPMLTKGDTPLRRPDDLCHHSLIHVEWKDAEASWRMWLLAAGLRDIDPTRGLRFTQESMAVQAALEGQGVALIGDRLVADHVAAGAPCVPLCVRAGYTTDILVSPFDIAEQQPTAQGGGVQKLADERNRELSRSVFDTHRYSKLDDRVTVDCRCGLFQQMNVRSADKAAFTTHQPQEANVSPWGGDPNYVTGRFMDASSVHSTNMVHASEKSPAQGRG